MLIWRLSLPWRRMRFALRWRMGFDQSAVSWGFELVHAVGSSGEISTGVPSGEAVKIALTHSAKPGISWWVKRRNVLLYWLLYQKLFPYFRLFRIFRYLTFRTVFASLTALLIGLLIGPYVIEKLREFQIGQYIREEGPQSHQKKSGTPTMGGVLICISILVPTLLWSDLSNPYVWLVMLSTLAFGAIGFADDYIKVVHRRNQGLTARAKLGLAVCGERGSGGGAGGDGDARGDIRLG